MSVSIVRRTYFRYLASRYIPTVYAVVEVQELLLPVS